MSLTATPRDSLPCWGTTIATAGRAPRRQGAVIVVLPGTSLEGPGRCPLPARPCPAARSGSAHRSPQRPEEHLQVCRQLGRGLHRREVLAARELGPVRAGRRGDHLAYRLVGAEDREALRYGRRRAPVGRVRLLVKGVRGGGAGASEPV